MLFFACLLTAYFSPFAMKRAGGFYLLFFACLLTAYFSPFAMKRGGNFYLLFLTLSCERLFFTVTAKDESERSAVDTFHV